MLLNCLGKIAEKLVTKRLSQLCEDNQLLHEGQMGGRLHRSATDAILALTHDVELGQKQQLATSALFMDVKGVFDNVSRYRLIHTMTEMGLPQPLISWTTHFMTSRKIALAFDGEEEDLHPVETGIPQGSPTSPILFIIYLQPLFVRLKQAGLNINTPSYMDDVALVTQSPSLKTNTATQETAASIAFDWADVNAVAFDDSKSELIHFY